MLELVAKLGLHGINLTRVYTFPIDVPVPTSVTVSRITCTSALVSWNEVADNVDYEISWRLLVDGWEGSERSQGVATVSGLNHYMLENLLTSDDNVIMRYGVRVSSVKQGVKGSYCSEIVFSTNTNGNYSYSMLATLYLQKTDRICHHIAIANIRWLYTLKGKFRRQNVGKLAIVTHGYYFTN